MQVVNPVAPVTHVGLASVEQRFRDMVIEALEQFQIAPVQAPIAPQNLSDQLSAEASTEF